MADREAAAKRAAGLTRLFNAVIHGHRNIKTAGDGNRFLEALCSQEDASKCVECLIASSAGLAAVSIAFRLTRETTFLNGLATSVLSRLSEPSVKQLYGGQFLQRVLEQIVQPPTFWNTLVEAHNARLLSSDATRAFAWLLLELLYSRSEDIPDVRDIAERVTNNGSFISSDSLHVRNVGYKIKHVLDSTSDESADGPGGRHDNDFAQIHKIKLLPTPDEFACSEPPFYRRADSIASAAPESRGLTHVDNQFRLLREDLLGELRNDFQIASGQKKGRRKIVLEHLKYAGIDCGPESKRKPCSLKLSCPGDVPQLRNVKGATRKKYLADNKNVLKHQSLGCLISNGNIVAFATVDRDEDLLAQQPAIVVLRVADASSFGKVLMACKLAADLCFVQVDTAVFAYEPILKCLQSLTELPLEDQLLGLTPSSAETVSGIQPTKTINAIHDNWDQDLQDIIGSTHSIKLDQAQADSLLTGLLKRVSLIQGPPGTGKSFIGALIAKILHDHTNETMLILTYTNHALDQFLEDIQKAGIPASSIVRLGSKSNANTRALTIREQPNNYKMTGQTWAMIQDQKAEAESYHDALLTRISSFASTRLSEQMLLDFLEFSDDSEYFDAFVVPNNQDGMTIMGKKNKRVDEYYLVKRWVKGEDAGVFSAHAMQTYPHIWHLAPQTRLGLQAQWNRTILEERVAEISALAHKYNECRAQIDRLFREKNFHVLSQKRIIGCTTTAAAMYTDEIRKASPGIILVEEAGEILESHILTALTPTTKQLILIGDHKQLRPKVNNYALTVEKGDGYDLNVSLFERLVLSGVPHTTLSKQHRMRPEISSLVRSLTYPELEDAEKTQGRPDLRGFQSNVIFVSHSRPELNAVRIADRRDGGANSSKENLYEAEMVLKCVRYLGQQGYGTEDIVVLTPYLGQLFLLVNTLSNENDPILNDLDSHELIQAGLITPASANISKRKLRISTIDNYQGEESDIVIACLTRSNADGDIGFMSSPQRVNVLLSRARNGLIMIGNADTFMNSRKGKEVWVPLMDQLKRDGHVYDGFPVRCEQHPEKTALLTEKEHFDTVCPDGGCSEPCGKLLNCGVHTCPHRCHQLQDHSRMDCKVIISSTCPSKHKTTRKCHDKATAHCRKCEAEVRAREKKRQRDHELDKERDAKQGAYAARLVEIEEEIEYQKRMLKEQAEERDRQQALEQKKQDLRNLQGKVKGARKPPVATSNTTPTPSPDSPGLRSESAAPNAASGQRDETTVNVNLTSPDQDQDQPDWDKSEARDDWEWQKKYEGAENEALDSLVPMIGLESVKQQFLDIKAKVDTMVRQGVSLKGERFGAALLGNPGTGKTTVARYYSKFLVQVGALPGGHFIESSGSALANDGVSACKAHIDTILEEGGGVFFIDEAYQLVSGNSPGGKAVLDYLLAEIENLTGKVVFVLAGYHKQMEAFFAHNPGIPSRIPIRMEFQDYKDGELQQIFCQYIDKKYHGHMKIEDGMNGLYVRIAARRIGRGRGRDGFGNAREVQNKIAQITERQAKRLRKERRAGKMPNDHILTREDLIGPEPSSVLKNNATWTKLQKLTGLASVKESVQVLLDGIQTNYQLELQEKPIIQYSLNRCFIGSPGTGKTTVAKLYGRILADIGLLSNGEVIIKSPADFVGSVLGGSEANTKAILASTVGKVLIIDEAYMLASGAAGDPYKAAVIDTIVAEVQSTAGEDRCVLLLGYKDQMEEMFRDVNPGFARRFPLESAFVFEDFNDTEIRQIFDTKLKGIGFDATDQAKKVAMEVVQRARNHPNFGNAGEVDIILDRAKAVHQKHITSAKVKQFGVFEAIDFDPDFDRGERAATELSALFHDVVGCEDLIKQFQGYQTTAANLKALGMDAREQLPFNFLFKGPPGTGKTTTAAKMGKIFYDMGFLSQARVEECSATDLIGQYVGQTGPKVQKLMEKAMGKVLFIDEAYRLAEGGFATEAMDELVDCLTKPKFAQKLVVILAGYDKDIDRLMSMNPGLTSRFPETVMFKHLEPEICLELLVKDLQKRKKKVSLDLSVVDPPTPELRQRLLQLFGKLTVLESWGNARDVKSLAKSMFQALISTAVPPIASLALTETIVINTIEKMLDERSRRNAAVGTNRFDKPMPLQPMPQPQTQNPAPPTVQDSTITTDAASPPAAVDTHKQESEPKQNEKKPEPAAEPDDPLDSIFKAKRDPGVSDEVWEQLERDKHAMVAREREFRHMQEEKRQYEERIKEFIRAEKAAADEEERRIREQARIAAELERRRRDEELAAIERERKKEMERQKKLKVLGPCPMGYMWIKQASGYRCAGGSHTLSDDYVDAF